MGRLRNRRALGVLILFVVIVVVALETSEPKLPDAEVLGKKVEQGPVIDAACDVDGVTVGWDASFRSTPTTAGYRVVTANVSGVAPTCAGAVVTVRLLNGTTTLATGTASAAATTVAVPFTSPAAAREVNGVYVEIAGGTVPVPADCNGMTFDRFKVLTGGNDSFTASGDRDLVYGLEGADTILGSNQGDCLDGQAGNDVLNGENHADVLIGGANNDTLDGGNHDDLLIGGDGNDVLRGGNGRDVCRGGAGTNTFVSCEVQS